MYHNSAALKPEGLSWKRSAKILPAHGWHIEKKCRQGTTEKAAAAQSFCASHTWVQRFLHRSWGIWGQYCASKFILFAFHCLPSLPVCQSCLSFSTHTHTPQLKHLQLLTRTNISLRELNIDWRLSNCLTVSHLHFLKTYRRCCTVDVRLAFAC